MNAAGDREYLPSTTMPDAQRYFDQYRADSAAARARYAFELHRYGETAAEALDLYVATPGAPLLVFFHGGYWRAFSKDDFSYVVEGFAPHGVSVALVDYGLAPAVPLATIVEQARAAVRYLQALTTVDDARIVASGHSAGGHLAAMCAVSIPLRGVATISGLHDLVPLLETSVNGWLGLDAAAARALSPVRYAPAAPLAVDVSDGGLESASFHRQAQALVDAWSPRGARIAYATVPGTHHFSVVQHLGDPASALTQRILALLIS